MMRQSVRFALCLALLGGIVIPTAHEIVAQTVVCYKKKCVVYPDGEAICQYTPVDCGQVNIE